MSDTAGANPEQGPRNWPKSPISVPRALAACRQRPLFAMPRLRDCKQGTVPTGSARGATGWQPQVDSAQEALGLVDSAHLHTSEKKK